MAQLSDERKAYLKNYKKTNLKRVPLELSNDFYVKVQIHAALKGESINGFIKRAIAEALERETDPGEKSSRLLNSLKVIAETAPKTK